MAYAAIFYTAGSNRAVVWTSSYHWSVTHVHNKKTDAAARPVDPRVVRILGIRGIPATHGGFETFAQHLAEYLVEKDWSVTVYCQTAGTGPIVEEEWRGIRLIKISEPRTDALGTMRFDWRCIRHAAREDGLVLTLGYNTALFNLWFRLRGIKNIINMDGFEWKRSKWSLSARIWFFINDWAGCLIGNHLIADHPEIAKHLATRRSTGAITMIPYGANAVDSASIESLQDLNLEPKQYALCVARIEPENSILEIVRSFSTKKRNKQLVVLGAFNPEQNKYHASIQVAAGDEVRFFGAMYDKEIVESLRFHCVLYNHGHTVGGTNPSLVEALGAGSPVLAHDNCFNRWVAGNDAAYFWDEKTCCKQLDQLLENSDILARMGRGSKDRFSEVFQWEGVLEQYNELLVKMNDQ